MVKNHFTHGICQRKSGRVKGGLGASYSFSCLHNNSLLVQGLSELMKLILQRIELNRRI